MITRLTELFKKTFDRGQILEWARELGALERLRSIHPADLGSAVLACASGDEERSIACARRLFDRLAGYMPEESSFYNRFNPGLAALMKSLYERALQASTQEQQAAVAAALESVSLTDILAIDASQCSLPAAAAAVLPSTHPKHGGIKVTATLSILHQSLRRISVTDARTHDRKALRIDRWLHNQLLLLDRGYSDHSLLASIEDRRGLFVTRLKESSIPTVAHIRSGLGRKHVGRRLTGELPYRGTLDLDADFSVRGHRPRRFRVVRVTVCSDRTGERFDIWIVTNLPVSISAEQIATLYRLRWEVEVLFRVLKSVGRLDQLRSSNVDVIHTFLYATLLGLVLAQQVCAEMRRARPDCEPSLYRVATLVLGYLPQILGAPTPGAVRSVIGRFNAALWREGVNPNPGRAYAATRYANDFSSAASA